ncbi:MAG: SGNH/GDSL hydrolase family protein [Thermodesulfobacteriota bacterium]
MKPLIFKAAAVFISVLAFLAVLEIVVRVFNLAQPRLGQQDPVFGTSYIAGQTAINEYGVEIEIGGHGYRGPTPAPDKPAGVYRVVLLGDSFLQARVLPYEQVFYSILNERFKKQGRPIEVINMGVEGYGTAQEYLVYRHQARRYRPDLVILFFYVGNDLQENYPPQENRPGFKLKDGRLEYVPFEVKGRRRGPVKDFLRKHVRLYNYLPDLFRAAAGNLSEWVSGEEKARRLEEHRLQFEQSADLEPTRRAMEFRELDSAWQVTLKVMEKLKNEAAADGAVLALADFPMITQVYDRYWNLLLSRNPGVDTSGWDRFGPQRILEEFARQEGIRYLPFSRFLAETARKTGRMYYLPGDYHFSAPAHELLAEFFEPIILEYYRKRF